VKMNEYLTLAQIDATAAAVRARTDKMPELGLILGSGLGSLADAIEDPVKIPYNALPHWPVSTVIGHVGQLVLGQLQGQQVVVMQGRAHYYEGYSMAQVTLPVRVMQRLGVRSLIVTNAAGGVNPDFEPGELMMLTDHLNLLGMAGLSPLRGPNLDELGPRFPDMSRAYDLESPAGAQVAAEKGVTREASMPVWPGHRLDPADLRFYAHRC
jgi:purine-nucleoside phosphorylase